MESRNLTLGSLFDGSGGFPLGGLISGITPVWSSEIEPFPIRVTTKRLPYVKHYGDVSTLDGAKLPPVDIITFGSPCTDMSVAGKRAGLGGKQSCLFYQAIRIVKEMRCATDEKSPRFIVWENVPGAFSSNKGKDFKTVLEEICKVKDPNVHVPESAKWQNAGEIMGDGYSIAWRVFDAQFWGVPQRRKRIYLVADFNGGSAGKILFESESVSGYTPQSFCSWQGTTVDFKESIGAASKICLNDQGGKRMDVTENITCTLRAKSHHPPCIMESAGFCTEHSAKARGIGFEEETTPTLRAGIVPATVYENHPFVAETLQAYGICSKHSNSMKSDNPHSGFYKAKTARTLDTSNQSPSKNQGGIAVVCLDQNEEKSYCNISKEVSPAFVCTNDGKPAVCVQGSVIGRKDENGPQGSGFNEGVSFTLNATDKHIVAYPTYCTSKNSHHIVAEKEVASTLVATDYKDPPVINDISKEPKYIVRRLTPTECARLQGFPDWWCSGLETENPTEDDLAFWHEVFETHRKIMKTSSKPKSDKQIIKWLKNPHSDSAEYKMWGNGVALPNVYFVLSGIVYYSQFPDFLL